MAKQSNRYKKAREKVNSTERHAVGDALELLRQFDGAKFDETVELVVKLGVDPRRSDQMVRGAFSLPKGTGKESRVIVFADGEEAEAALKAGAIEAGGEELVKKVGDGWLEFDVAIAAPQMMRMIARLGRLLGPKGLMPSPKSGTVTEDLEKAVMEFKAGKIEYRCDSGGNVHVPVGKLSFVSEDIQENIEAFLEHLLANRPSGAKGAFVQRAFVCATMSPSVRLAVS